MNYDLMIETLEYLEEIYPDADSVSKIVEDLCVPFDESFRRILGYLEDIAAIRSELRRDDNVNPYRRLEIIDKIAITPKGIDFLSRKRLVLTRGSMNNTVMWATLVIALSAMAQFMFNLKNIEGMSLNLLLGLLSIAVLLTFALFMALNNVLSETPDKEGRRRKKRIRSFLGRPFRRNHTTQ